MSKTLIVPAATPYAEALLLSGGDNVEKDMIKILDILKDVEPLEGYFLSPRVDAKTKKEFTKKIFEKQISSVSLNFLLLLIDRRRIGILSPIIEKYLELRNNECNEVNFEITSVVPLNSDQETNLINQLKSLSNAEVVKISVKQDPTILGGLLVQNGSQFIDLSINGELRNISSYLGSNFEF
jgi:F-type H+-transporting ATPase subunit delta